MNRHFVVLSWTLFPVLIQAQIFNSPPFTFIPPRNLFTGTFNYRPQGAPVVSFPAPSNVQQQRDRDSSYTPLNIEFDLPVSNQDQIILPTLPAKYETAIQYRSGPRGRADRPSSQSYPEYAESSSYPDYTVSYPTYPAGNPYEQDQALFKSVYPKNSFDGQSYGSYTEFLKRMLLGKQSAPVMVSQEIPMFNADSTGSQTSSRVNFDSPPRASKNQMETRNFDVPNRMMTFGPVLYSEHPPRPLSAESRDVYQSYERNINSYPEQLTRPNRNDQTRYQFDAPSRFVQSEQNFYGQSDQNYKRQKQPSLDSSSQATESRREAIFLPNTNSYDSYKPRDSYRLPAPEYSVTYEVGSTPQFYEPNLRSRKGRPTDYQEDQSRRPIGSSYADYHPVKYPLLGTEADAEYKLQPVPAVIAALFGNRRNARVQEQHHRQPESRKMAAQDRAGDQRHHDQYMVPGHKYEYAIQQKQSQQYATPTLPSYGGGADAPKDRRRYEHGAIVQDGGSLDIVIPVPRPPKPLDPLKTIVFPAGRTLT